MPSPTVRESVLDMEYESTQYEEAGFDCYRALSSHRGSSDFSTSVVSDIKEAVLTGLRDMVKDINGNGLLAQVSVNEEGRNPGGTSTAIDTAQLVSKLPDAKSWRDYVTQYWTSNPECHQYRAGVNMLPHERKIHRSRLSRMKIIAEFVQARFDGDMDRFETEFSCLISGDMTVNKSSRRSELRSVVLECTRCHPQVYCTSSPNVQNVVPNCIFNCT
ncbi:hypothetical protein F443_22658 [Phytophthora nicotianae P1569]|uniref:Uncharacterized protein n=1 Tax=Phytophthora nicotianae P1569 TaxID=1317065 RepID=V9DTP0_PHYNI|nr:hypothetical protein F443_22658 [Phytophthora nicotianae P1569]